MFASIKTSENNNLNAISKNNGYYNKKTKQLRYFYVAQFIY